MNIRIWRHQFPLWHQINVFTNFNFQHPYPFIQIWTSGELLVHADGVKKCLLQTNWKFQKYCLLSGQTTPTPDMCIFAIMNLSVDHVSFALAHVVFSGAIHNHTASI